VPDTDVIAASLTDPQAFAAIFDRHHQAIYRYLTRRLGSSSAEDMTSEVFARAFDHRSRFDLERESARPWLFGIARNVLMNEHRRRVNDRASPVANMRQEVPDPADAVAWAVDARRHVVESGLTRTIADLHEDTREILYLFAFAELTYAEIAETLGVPLGTVRSRLARARAAIREQASPFTRSMDETGVDEVDCE
jgi:RNA polymerase sigma-70 factor (ECF subfamily)